MHKYPQHEEYQEVLILNVLSGMAYEEGKSLDKIKNLLLIKQDQRIVYKFWQIVDQMIPNHNYSYVGCCGECGTFELREDL